MEKSDSEQVLFIVLLYSQGVFKRGAYGMGDLRDTEFWGLFFLSRCMETLGQRDQQDRMKSLSLLPCEVLNPKFVAQ